MFLNPYRHAVGAPPGGGSDVDLTSQANITAYVTAARASAAWTQNSSGLIVSVASNTPRLWHDGAGVAKGLICETVARTNHVPTTMSDWDRQDTPYDSGVSGPESGANWWELGDEGVGGFLDAEVQPSPFDGSSDYVLSVYAAPGAGNGDYLYMDVLSRVSTDPRCYFDLSTGAGSPVTSIAEYGSVAGAASSYRCWVDMTSNSAALPVVEMRVAEADGDSNVSVGDSIYLAAPLLELSQAALGGQPGSPILGAAGTSVAAETLTFDVSGAGGPSSGTATWTFDNNDTDTSPISGGSATVPAATVHNPLKSVSFA